MNIRGMQLIKTYWLTVLLGIVSLALTAADMGMLVVMALGVWLTIWFFYSLSKLQKKKTRWTPFLVKSAVWVVVCTGIFVIQGRFADAARHKADAVAALVVAYKQAHGTYPQSLAALPASDAKLIHDSDVRYSITKDGVPMLFYVSRTTLFTNYVYQFNKGTWRTIGD